MDKKIAEFTRTLVNMVKCEKDEAAFIALINNKDVKGAFLNNQELFVMFANNNPGDDEMHVISVLANKRKCIDIVVPKDELSTMSKDIIKLLHINGSSKHIPYLNWDGSFSMNADDIHGLTKEAFMHMRETLSYDGDDLY